MFFVSALAWQRMRQFDCPQCGAPVVFQSATAEASVCSFCQTVVVRKDVNVEAIGSMAVLPPDVSPLQVGARGRLGEWGFMLLGRVRVAWKGGSWNEWFAEFSDGGRGWVAESQGFFMVLREEKVVGGVKGGTKLKVGESVGVNDLVVKVVDSKEVECVGGEGELPVAVVTGERWVSTDVEAGKGVVGTLEKTAEGWRFFKGKVATFEELGWQGLKEMPGWNGVPLVTERGLTEGFNCPNCGGVVVMRAAGVSMAVSCSHCGSVLDATLPKVELLQKGGKKRKVKATLPLGTRGVWKGVEWQVIGFMQRKDKWAPWLEYLLFNPFKGYLWLTEYKGHWAVVERVLEAPGVAVSGVRPWIMHEGREYKQYAKAACEVTYVEGEFYWLVEVGEKAVVTDFIAPPFVLSSETYVELNEVTWSAGEYATSRQLSEGFKVPLKDFPTTQGLGMLQPSGYGEKWNTLKSVVKWVALIWLGLQIFTGGSCSGKKEYEGEFEYATPAVKQAMGMAPDSVAVTPPFEVTKQGGVEVEVRAPVNNNWLGLDVELINATTGERRPGEVTVEYYQGVDSDGRWEEGSRQATATIPGVEPGTYTLALDAAADAAVGQMTYDLVVTSGHKYFSNFVLGLLALLVYPIFVGWRHWSFESRRWSNAD